MPLEIEAKMKVAEHDKVRERLRQLGAKPAGRTLETNVFFDTNDHSLRNQDKGLRLRTNHDVESGQDSFVVTYKDPRRAGQAKSREEIELTVTDRDATVELFEKLGYQKELSFEKRRESWKLGACKVELDEMPYLGTFVEVEGPDESHVMKIREELGLADEPMIKPSYIAMLMDYLRERGLPPQDIRFDAK